MLDKTTILKWWSIFKEEDATVAEVRLLTDKATYSGYFSDVDTMLSELDKHDYLDAGIYATLNPCKEALMSRRQGNQLLPMGKSDATTSDNDIDAITALFIDLDPKRPAKVNATDQEKAKALEVARKIFGYMRDAGFNDPVIADSGNGFHLYYQISLENTANCRDLLKRILEGLDNYFGTDAVEIDRSVFNPSRIVKVIGTESKKGRNTQDRPQRLSKFVYVPEEYKFNDIVLIRKVADQLSPSRGKEDTGRGWTRATGDSETFSLEDFIARHGIEVQEIVQVRDGKRFRLKCCPFDGNHKDAVLFQWNSGAIGFNCFHNSCSTYTWQDVRMKYEPNAYTKQDRSTYDSRHRWDRVSTVPSLQRDPQDDRGAWLNPSQIRYISPSDTTFIPTGIRGYDAAFRGLAMGETTIITGQTGAGKTSLLDVVILNAVNRGFKVAVWSGEMAEDRFISWIDRMAAGKCHVRPTPGYEGLYYVPELTAKKINGWLDGKLYLYNNKLNDSWTEIRDNVEKIVREQQPHLVVLDNLSVLDFTALDEANEYTRQAALVRQLSAMAKKLNLHIILVCHPRKEQRIVRADSISGTNKLPQLVDNVLILHRLDEDFRTIASGRDSFISEKRLDELTQRGYTNVIEVAKSREEGRKDVFIGLYYEPETKRLRSTLDENIVYNWDDCAAETGIIELDETFKPLQLPEPPRITNIDDFPDPIDRYDDDEIDGDLPED